MAVFVVNGVNLQTTQGAASVSVSGNSFTLSWSGLSMLSQWGEEYFEYSMDNAVLQDEGIRHYTSQKWGDVYVNEMAGYNVIVTYNLLTSSSGSKTITSDSSLAGKTLRVSYIDRNNSVSQELYITFQSDITPCKGPSWCRLEYSYSIGEGMLLSWGEGTPGQNNPIDHYDVWAIEYDQDDNEVSDWWIEAKNIPPGTHEALVRPPQTPGHYTWFWVHAYGRNMADDDNDYEGCDSETGLQRVTLCAGPSWCRLSKTESAGEPVTLSWGAGSSGVANRHVGYEVWKALCDPDGDYPEDWEWIADAGINERSVEVYPPDIHGQYYLFSVLSVGEVYNTDYGEDWRDSENLLRRTHAAFGAWTDPVLTVGSSHIRAIHITELQERTNILRGYYGLNAYQFTPVTAGVTKVAKWATLISEIRSAIDAITTNHEAWNALEAGKPRIANITQLRSIIDGL